MREDGRMLSQSRVRCRASKLRQRLSWLDRVALTLLRSQRAGIDMIEYGLTVGESDRNMNRPIPNTDGKNGDLNTT